MERRIYQIYEWFNSLCDRKQTIEKKEATQYFTEDIEVYTNADEALVGIDQFLKHIKISLSRYEKSYVVMPFHQIIIEKNKAALYYTIETLNVENEPFSFIVMSILEFQGEKIFKWWEVIIEKENLSH